MYSGIEVSKDITANWIPEPSSEVHHYNYCTKYHDPPVHKIFMIAQKVARQFCILDKVEALFLMKCSHHQTSTRKANIMVEIHNWVHSSDIAGKGSKI